MPRVRKQAPPGAGRPNRTDMTVPKVPTGLPYGEAGKLSAAQSAVPIETQQGPDFEQLSRMAQAHPTGNVVGLDAPTQRPDEPITAGIASGAGPGPDFALARHDPTADILVRLEAFYQRWPTPELSAILREARRG